jgi:parallel beta-helix repeat protein
MTKRVALSVCASVVLLVSHAAARVTTISTCGFSIFQPGRYRVTQDLTCPFSGIAVVINSNNVELHLDGHALNGGGTAEAGVAVVKSSNVGIFGGGTVTGFSSGIIVSESSGVRIVDITANNNGIGFDLVSTRDNALLANTAKNNQASGISLITASNNILLSNQADSSAIGIEVDATSSGNLIQSNKAHHNTTVDLEDLNPGCDANTWKSNQFETANQACIR